MAKCPTYQNILKRKKRNLTLLNDFLIFFITTVLWLDYIHTYMPKWQENSFREELAQYIPFCSLRELSFPAAQKREFSWAAKKGNTSREGSLQESMSPIHTRERGNVFSEEGKEKSALRSRDTRWRNFWKREARNPRHRAPTPGCGNWSGREAEKGRERVGNTAAFPLRCNSGSLNLAGCPSSPHYPPPSCATVRLLFPPHPRRAQARQNRAPLSSKDPPPTHTGRLRLPDVLSLSRSSFTQAGRAGKRVLLSSAPPLLASPETTEPPRLPAFSPPAPRDTYQCRAPHRRSRGTRRRARKGRERPAASAGEASRGSASTAWSAPSSPRFQTSRLRREGERGGRRMAAAQSTEGTADSGAAAVYRRGSFLLASLALPVLPRGSPSSATALHEWSGGQQHRSTRPSGLLYTLFLAAPEARSTGKRRGRSRRGRGNRGLQGLSAKSVLRSVKSGPALGASPSVSSGHLSGTVRKLPFSLFLVSWAAWEGWPWRVRSPTALCSGGFRRLFSLDLLFQSVASVAYMT